MMDLYSKWKHMPWKHWNSPTERWKELPTFVIIEYLVYLMTCITFLHARRQGKQHLFVWCAAFITGSANDIFFMALPLVDNFWQAQATIMITPRLPLYICCIYNVFLYTATVSIWRLKLPRLAEAAMSGLVAELIYGPYDILGAKFLWWTWHDTDPPIKARVLGVPIGSCCWILTFTGTFAFFIRTIYLERRITFMPLALAIVALISTPTMMAKMALLQAISGDTQGQPTQRSFALCFLIFIAIIGFQYWTGVKRENHPSKKFVGGPKRFMNNGILILGILIYFTTLTLIICLGVPETHQSTGVHQTYGPCGVEMFDFTGQKRHKYVCAKELDEDYDFSCLPGGAVPSSSPPTEWYKVCGRSHSNKQLWMAGVAGFCATGIAFYSTVLGQRLTTGKKLA